MDFRNTNTDLRNLFDHHKPEHIYVLARLETVGYQAIDHRPPEITSPLLR